MNLDQHAVFGLTHVAFSNNINIEDPIFNMPQSTSFTWCKLIHHKSTDDLITTLLRLRPHSFQHPTSSKLSSSRSIYENAVFCSADVKRVILLAWEIGDVLCIQILVQRMWSDVSELCWRFALKQPIVLMQFTQFQREIDLKLHPPNSVNLQLHVFFSTRYFCCCVYSLSFVDNFSG